MKVEMSQFGGVNMEELIFFLERIVLDHLQNRHDVQFSVLGMVTTTSRSYQTGHSL